MRLGQNNCYAGMDWSRWCCLWEDSTVVSFLCSTQPHPVSSARYISFGICLCICIFLCSKHHAAISPLIFQLNTTLSLYLSLCICVRSALAWRAHQQSGRRWENHIWTFTSYYIHQRSAQPPSDPSWPVKKNPESSNHVSYSVQSATNHIRNRFQDEYGSWSSSIS